MFMRFLVTNSTQVLLTDQTWTMFQFRIACVAPSFNSPPTTRLQTSARRVRFERRPDSEMKSFDGDRFALNSRRSSGLSLRSDDPSHPQGDIGKYFLWILSANISWTGIRTRNGSSRFESIELQNIWMNGRRICRAVKLRKLLNRINRSILLRN
jgi:hypothetical protein